MADASWLSARAVRGVKIGKPPALRKRLLMPRSTKIVVAPTRAYKITAAKKVIHTPVLGVTASSTFIRL